MVRLLLTALYKSLTPCIHAYLVKNRNHTLDLECFTNTALISPFMCGKTAAVSGCYSSDREKVHLSCFHLKSSNPKMFAGVVSQSSRS